MEQYTFNRDYLLNILSGITDQFDIYVNHEYLSLFDPSELADSTVGYGYDNQGEAHKFKYSEIEHLKFGQDIFDLEMLAKELEGEKPEEEDAPKDEEEPTDDGAPAPDSAPAGKPGEEEDPKKEESIRYNPCPKYKWSSDSFNQR